MGKYHNSELHAWYSDWHYQHCQKDAWLTDIDRLWIEMGRRDPIAYMDLKVNGDDVTLQEMLAMDWFEARGVPAYIVYVDGLGTSPNFQVMRWKTQERREMSTAEYVDWVNVRRFGW